MIGRRRTAMKSLHVASPLALGRPRERFIPRGRWLPPLSVAAAVVVADLATKAWATQYVVSLSAPPMRTALVQVRRVYNRGVAFGLGANHPGLVGVVGVVAIAALLRWMRSARSLCERLAVAVVLGGAVGNLVERLARGSVTDWLHVWPYPATFNLADVAVRSGVLAAVLVRMFAHGRASRRSI
jgi:signal peptidase II